MHIIKRINYIEYYILEKKCTFKWMIIKNNMYEYK